MHDNKKSDDDKESVDEIIDTAEGDIELEDIDINMSDKLKILREKLKECEKEKMTHMEELQRARADFLNSKRRIEEQSVSDIEKSTNKVLISLLPLIDSFDSAMADTDAWSKVDPKWKEGVEAIYTQLSTLLRSYGVNEIEADDTQFDPTIHEAISNQTVEDEDQIDSVVEVHLRGYQRDSNVLRPAKVSVGKK